jgi:hypothetical protein
MPYIGGETVRLVFERSVMERRLVVIALVLSFCLLGCADRAKRANRGFYYWKNDFRLDSRDRTLLNKLAVNKLYIKFFDVVWENGPVPVATVKFSSKPPQDVAVVPTVFIVNDTLKKMSPASVPDLAEKISFKIRRTLAIYHLTGIREVQFDCDWTDSTRDKYFTLLRRLKADWERERVRISATIRLHQIKYRGRTGVPPVDRGMLMFYNMTEVTRFDTKNSILNLEAGKAYTVNLGSYPLPLDAALPIFSWGVIFQDQRFIGLARDFRSADMKRKPFHRYRANIFRVDSDIYLHGSQLYHGDLIRIEESDYAECRKSAAYLRRNLKIDSQTRLLLFHFDQNAIGGMGYEKLEKVYRAFH